MTCNEALSKYMDFLDAEGKADNTMKSDNTIIKKFLDNFNFVKVSEINYDAITNYVIFLKDDMKVAGTTSNIYMNRIKKFLDYLYSRDYIDNDIGSQINLLPPDKARNQRGKNQFCDILEEPGRVMTPREIDTVIKMAYTTWRNKKPPYALMVETLLVSGFRVNQLLTVQVKNMGFNDGIVRIINEKTNRMQEFPFGNDELLQRLKQYCAANGILKPDDLLFPSSKNTPIHQNNFRNMVLRKVFLRSGLEYGKGDSGFTSHDFRRTCGTMLNSAGMPLTELQERLGHKDIKTTRKYIKKTFTPEQKAKTANCITKSFYSYKCKG